MESLATRLAWSGELGTLVEENAEILIESPLAWSSPLAQAWLRVKPHWNILTPVGASQNGRLLLRYAAIDRAPAKRTPNSWGLEIVRAFELLRMSLSLAELGLFAHPRAWIDLDGHVRLELLEGPPRALATEAALSALCRETLAQLSPETIEAPPVKQAPSLRYLNVALHALGGRSVPPDFDDWRAWQRFERAAGWFVAGNPRRAGEQLIAAPQVRDRNLIAAAGELAHELVTPSTAYYFGWPLIARCIAERPARDALALLGAIRIRPRGYDELHAELSSAIGDYRGVPFAKLLETCPDDLRYLRGYATQLLDGKDPAAAMIPIDRWIALAPDDAAAHALLGRALAALGHPERARAAHDRAAQLGYLPSQFARTNLDRAAKQLRLVAGSESYRNLPVPAHLGDLVPLLSQGRLLDAILWLTERYADPEARTLLASCYAYAGDAESALHVHEADANLPGIARCLVALGRSDEAFARAGEDAALVDELRELTGQPAARIAWTRG